MLKKLWCWLVGSNCTWATVREAAWSRDKCGVQSCGTGFILRCNTCGKIKFTKIKA